MKRKPDVMLTLLAVFLLSLAVSGYTTLTQETSQRQSELAQRHYSSALTGELPSPGAATTGLPATGLPATGLPATGTLAAGTPAAARLVGSSSF